MIIEYYRDQDLNKLREDVITAYILLSRNLTDIQGDFSDWNPEKQGRYNDVWVLIHLLERWGYHSSNWDTILYTFEFQEFDAGKDSTCVGEGLDFNQAVCNAFVSYALIYSKRLKQRENE